MTKITTKNKISKILLSSMFALALPMTCLFCATSTTPAKASSDNSVKFYTKIEDINNNSFDDISSTYATNSVDGWSLIRNNTKATTMIIDVDKNFSNYNATPYCISALETGNPGKKGADNKILMINSANKDNNPSSASYKAEDKHEGYKSDEITLKENSYYSFQASFKTLSFTNVAANPFASIYLSGLTDEQGNKINLEYEMISAKDWNTVYFFVATGDVEQKVNLELWLGTNEQSSFGVAFFDEVYVQRYSENYFYECYYDDFYSDDNFYYNIEKTNTDSNNKKYNYFKENSPYNDELDRPLVSLCELDETSHKVEGMNLNFDNNGELSSPADWTVQEGNTASANALVFDLNSTSFKNIVKNNYAYTGSNLSYKNKKALAMWTKEGETGHIALSSKNIEIKANETLKISAKVKVSSLVSGNFELIVKENDTIIKNFSYLEGSYKPLSTNTTVSSNGSNLYENEYNTATIYLQGHDLYDSSFNIILSLGNETTLAEGCVVVDEITVEQVNFADYENANKKLKLTTTSTDQSGLTIANGFFNSANSSTKEYSYPLSASNWELNQDKNKNGLYAGVINTYEEYFDDFTSKTTWAKDYTTPAKDKTDTNNIYMFANNRASYQSIKSNEFTLSKGKYYTLSLDYMTLKTFVTSSANLYLDIYTKDDVLIYTATLSYLNNWDNYKAYLYAGERDLSVYTVISFGKEATPSVGTAYVDNVELLDTTVEKFNAAASKADLSNFMLNLDPTNAINDNISDSLAYTGAGTISSCGNGGIIKGKGNESYGYVKNGEPVASIDDGTLTNNVLVINTTKPGAYTLTSKFHVTLNSSTYYKLTFRLLTSLPDKTGKAKADAYGVNIGLKDMNQATNLVFNNGWTDCTMYFYNASSDSLDTNLVFTLKALTEKNTGFAYLTDIVWAEAGSDDKTFEKAFKNAKNDEDFGKTLFTAQYEAKPESSPNKGSSSKENESTNPLSVLIYISTGITALAVIIAIVGIIMRKVKFKKVNKTKAENYDRKITIDNNIITSEANSIIKEETTALETAIEKYKAEIKELEEKQKENIALSRKQNGKITKEIEREFKSYAQKHSKVQDKLNMLSERLDNVKSAEYRISLERKIAIQMLRTKKEALKKAKAEEKAKNKTSK